jgi:hypothetical protein
MKTNQTEGNGSDSAFTMHEERSRLQRLRTIGGLPAMLKAKAEENPGAAFVVIGAGAFVLGGLVASRVGRFAIAAAIPVLINRVLDGALVKELAEEFAHS